MVNIDFVPDDYIQERESSKANFLYLVLLGSLLGAIVVTFSIIKIRQTAVGAELRAVSLKMTAAKEQIRQLEELQGKRKEMMKTALMTAELLEPVPRSVLLACLTNNMPAGVSLLELKLVQRQRSAQANTVKKGGDYKSAKEAAALDDDSLLFKESHADTEIQIEGIAPRDIEVAGYIARLSGADLLSNVSLVESKEHEIDGINFREFKLKTMLSQDIELTKEDVENIRMWREKMM